MRIWIDADACPRAIKHIVFRAAERVGVHVRLVANKDIPTPPSRFVSAVRVAEGMDVADDYIAENVRSGDIVITADIPLAARVVEKGAVAIDPRGELYDNNNVRERLSTRNFMEKLRGAGFIGGGPSTFKPADKHKFANTLDRLLTKHFAQQHGSPELGKDRKV